MAEQLPTPPIPPDADLTHFDDMPLEVRRLRDSGIAGVIDAEAFRCGLLGWSASWHQLPAGSLPPADVDLCRLVGLGRDLKTWKRIKADAMRGWRPFADGRLYHPVVTEKVIAAWNSTRLNRWTKECDRIRKENKAREKRREAPLGLPRKPESVPYEWPPDSAWNSDGKEKPSDGIPTETALNRKEGKGVSGEAPSGLPPDEQQESPPAAARDAPKGAHTHDVTTRIAELASRKRA